MKRRLTKIGNSWGLVLPRAVLKLLRMTGKKSVEVEVIGGTLIVTSGDADPAEVEAALAYLSSKRERAHVYRRLADA